MESSQSSQDFVKSLIISLEDLYGRLIKQKSNFKKSPKERITKEYVEGRLELIEQVWNEFRSGHRELMRAISSVQEIDDTTYVKSYMYDRGEETYLDYKCELKTTLTNLGGRSSSTSSNVAEPMLAKPANVKLPKICIPKFSGKYSEWKTFHDLFSSLVHNCPGLDDVQKLLYLKGYLSGEAEQLLSNIPITQDNYSRCWQLLAERYNNKAHICQQVLKRLLTQTTLRQESAKGLRTMVDTTDDCLASLSNLQINVISWDILLIYILTSKLDPETRRQWEFSVTADNSSNELPTYKQFKDFLTKRFRAIECLDTGSTTEYKVQSNMSRKLKSLHVTNISCPFCREDHKLSKCKSFHNEEPDSRRKFVYDNNICYNCLGNNHSAKQCRTNIRCSECKRNHHSLLHPKGSQSAEVRKVECVAKSSDSAPTTESSSKAASTSATPSSFNAASSSTTLSCFATGKVHRQVLLATAIVKVIGRHGQEYCIRALLDQGSQASFVTESTVQYLGLSKIASSSQITGLNGDKQVVSKAVVTMEIQSRVDPQVKIQVKAHVLNNITSLLPTRRVEAMEWQELSGLVLADPDYHTPNKIDMLLGAEVYGHILRNGVKKCPTGTPIAQATSLGWILSGVISSTVEPSPRKVNVMHCCTNDNDLLKKFWELEADVPKPKASMFTEDEKLCEQTFAQTTQRDLYGRYIVRLPFKNGYPKVVGSREIAERRLKSLEHKLTKDPTLKVKYQEVITEYLELTHMEEVPPEEVNSPKAIYLPHHAVVRNDRETTKVRIVFDASCKGKNDLSLNDQLLVGPKLQPELRHIVMSWRCPPICMSADIVKMYRQVKTETEDSDCQRILWREDENKELKHYRHTRVTFGTSSAPYLAVKALQQVAHDHGAEYPEVKDRVLTDFYVDDLMTGVQTYDEGKKLFSNMKELLSKAGFELQKWNSNSNELVRYMNGDLKVKETGKDLKLKEDELVKIMGLTWNRSDDTFRYVVTLPKLEPPITKRKIISDISRLYDPLGWVGPNIILAKMMIQKLWIAGIGWDEVVPESLLNEWLTYRDEQQQLSEIRIPRWVGIKADDLKVELHGFCDASKAAYAAVVYIRVLDSERKAKVSLVSAKTRVAPVKQVSIPRLELCGAALLCKLLLEISEVLKIEKTAIHAWTDSTVVLAWLNSHPSRWNVFVANRVSDILTRMEPENWYHVTSKENPADCASRGLRPSELLNHHLWFNGPDFLHKENIQYLKPKNTSTELEVAKVKAHCVTEQDFLWDRYSSLTKTTRVIAYCRRFISQAKGAQQANSYITAKELTEALNVYIRQCQAQHFNVEVAVITQRKDLPKSSNLRQLNPFLDDDGLLRVGGRLNNSPLTFNRKHPILIPKGSHLTNLIIADAHKQTLHGGPQLTLAYIYTKYWIIGAKQLVKSHYRKCVVCMKIAAATKNPVMGQLPAARVTPARPFSSSGVDYAGPIQIRTTKGRGHHSYKGYICLFICMATRAIHLEAVSDLTTEGFLQAFKRFVARRGHCSHLWSDNGTNFIGAAAELQKRSRAEQKSIAQEIATSLASQECEWHFIPPHSPNFGGLWEAGVKSVKHHLRRIIGSSTLTYEEMATVLAQVEACLNSRPLSVVVDEPNHTVLTPGHFLIGEPLVTASDHNVEGLNVSTLRRWQHTQRMAQIFWRQWSREYLTKFLQRHKWSAQGSKPNIGDVVVIKDDNLPPARWLYGRIVDTHPGDDSVVRVVTLRTKNGTLKRLVSKLCFLPVAV